MICSRHALAVGRPYPPNFLSTRLVRANYERGSGLRSRHIHAQHVVPTTSFHTYLWCTSSPPCCSPPPPLFLLRQQLLCIVIVEFRVVKPHNSSITLLCQPTPASLPLWHRLHLAARPTRTTLARWHTPPSHCCKFASARLDQNPSEHAHHLAWRKHTALYCLRRLPRLQHHSSSRCPNPSDCLILAAAEPS